MFNVLLHVDIKLSSTLSRNLIKLLLLFNTFLVHEFPACNVLNVLIRRRDRIPREEVRYRIGGSNLGIMQQRPKECTQ